MSSFWSNTLMGDGSVSRNLLQPILNFSLRFYVAFMFFRSGLSKVDDKFQVTQKTIDHFVDGFKVPLIPADLAAYLSTYAELILPIMLVLGILTRPAALALFILNGVASYSLITAGWSTSIGQLLHIFWGTMLAVIIIYGPSKLSIDSWWSDKLRDNKSSLMLKLGGIIILSGLGYYLINTYLPNKYF